MNTVIYTRVSTSVQDYQRQIDELQQFASSRGWNVLQVFSEKVSGAKKNEERQELQSLMSYISTHNVEKVLVWELSRLGRNTLEVLKTIEEFNTLGISLFIKNYNIETLNEDEKPNVMSQFLVTILAEVARMERASIKERMDSGLKKYISNGGKVGRKVGYRKNNEKVQEEYSDVIKLLRKGISIRMNQRDQVPLNPTAVLYLKNQGCHEEADFYKGLVSLSEADYNQAYESFCQSSLRKSRLGQAYCLIHGMGTPVDHPKARMILKDYPDDAFACYLLTVSLYRTRTSAEIPAEVTELLNESCEMGYQPAETTLLLMKLAYTNQVEEGIADDELIRSNTKKVDKSFSDSEAVGANLFLGCHKLLRFLNVYKAKEDKNSDENADSIEDLRLRGESIVNEYYARLSPLAAYVRTLCQQTFSDTYRMEDWLKGLNGFNQSPEVRAWAVGTALTSSGVYEDDSDYNPLLGYYLKLVGDDVD